MKRAVTDWTTRRRTDSVTIWRLNSQMWIMTKTFWAQNQNSGENIFIDKNVSKLFLLQNSVFTCERLLAAATLRNTRWRRQSCVYQRSVWVVFTVVHQQGEFMEVQRAVWRHTEEGEQLAGTWRQHKGDRRQSSISSFLLSNCTNQVILLYLSISTSLHSVLLLHCSSLLSY